MRQNTTAAKQLSRVSCHATNNDTQSPKHTHIHMGQNPNKLKYESQPGNEPWGKTLSSIISPQYPSYTNSFKDTNTFMTVRALHFFCIEHIETKKQKPQNTQKTKSTLSLTQKKTTRKTQKTTLSQNKTKQKNTSRAENRTNDVSAKTKTKRC